MRGEKDKDIQTATGFVKEEVQDNDGICILSQNRRVSCRAATQLFHCYAAEPTEYAL
jgi:hypothetical protein